MHAVSSSSCFSASDTEKNTCFWRDRLPEHTGRLAEGGLRLAEGRAGRTFAVEAENRKEQPLLISYVTVVRNGVDTLSHCLESVRAQSYPYVEHIVVDGASTDGTLDIIKEHAGTLEYFVSEPDSGLYDAMNKAVCLARGDYICVLNADDWLEPEAAAIAVEALADAPEKTILQTAVYRHSAKHGKQRVRLCKPEPLHPGFIFAPGQWCHNTMYAAFDLYKIALYDSSYRIVADYKWVIQCLDEGAVCLCDSRPTLHFVEGGISSDGLASSRERMRVQQERFPWLTDEEAAMLCWSLTGGAAELFSRRPRHVSEYLQNMLRRYASHSDFTLALTWAMSVVFMHPEDIPVSWRKRLSRYLRAWLRNMFKGGTA